MSQPRESPQPSPRSYASDPSEAMRTKQILTLRFRQANGTSLSKLEAVYEDGATEDRLGFTLEDAHAVAKWFGLVEGRFVPSSDFLTTWHVPLIEGPRTLQRAGN
jgi:hypothetical protein